MISNEILASIDNISTTAEDSSYCVLESLVNFYSKDIDFMDFCSPELRTEIVMEGSILDNVKKAGKKDSNKLITFLAFLPRLIVETCKAIAATFNDSSLGKNLEKLDKAGDAASKKAMVKQINEKEGKEIVYFDEKSGKIKYKKTMKDGLIALGWLAGTADLIYNLFKDIKAEFDVTNPSKIRTFIDECDKIIHKKKEHSKSEVIDMAVGAMGDMISIVTKSAGGLTALGAAASAIVGRKLNELKVNGEKEEDHGVLVAVKELTNKLTIINAAVFAATGVVNVAKKILGYSNDFIVKPGEVSDAITEQTKEKLYNTIIEKMPEMTNDYPKEEDESDADYKHRITQLFFIERAKAVLPPGTPANVVDKYAEKAFTEIFVKEQKNIRKKSKEELNKEYEAAVKKYYDEKKKLHEENPTFIDKAKMKRDAKKKANEASPDEDTTKQIPGKIAKIKEKQEKKSPNKKEKQKK